MKKKTKENKNLKKKAIGNQTTKQEKGITLIVLVVTIVVILILAGVSMSVVIGNNGIIEQAQRAKIATVHAQVYEAIQLEAQSYFIEKGGRGL